MAFRLFGRLHPQGRQFEIAVKEVSARSYIDTTSSAEQRTHPEALLKAAVRRRLYTLRTIRAKSSKCRASSVEMTRVLPLLTE
jgi:hypothetical protein